MRRLPASKTMWRRIIDVAEFWLDVFLTALDFAFDPDWEDIGEYDE